MSLTNETIRADIKKFKGRIKRAEEKLAELPEGCLPYREQKKVERKRQILKNEIRHVENLIHYAQEALVCFNPD